ncbi:hypothetical protein [Nostoc sp. NMS4]|uniref:hypothetical protein n=1 Tax=Nostoc sp. NMS4 TaxID=2815390 RepID=UPI0025E0F37F|nr:hypothetical protein [Nostoc sp. NMS4]MBN3926976.1 hypothetical protein [Nostoc sp. NMS4]
MFRTPTESVTDTVHIALRYPQSIKLLNLSDIPAPHSAIEDVIECLLGEAS